MDWTLYPTVLYFDKGSLAYHHSSLSLENYIESGKFSMASGLPELIPNVLWCLHFPSAKAKADLSAFTPAPGLDDIFL